MIEPDVKDSVPDECGYYLIRHKETKMPKWFLARINILNDGEGTLICNYGNYETTEITEDEFDNYYWTEKIKGPDL